MSRAANETRTIAEQRVGLTLNGKWHLDSLIDVGGMAAVYAATHRNGNRVAVKILHPDFPEYSSVRERFLREGYLANKVNHPGAVRVLDDDVTRDDTVFLVMELLEGESLESVLQRGDGRLAPEPVLAMADQLLDVLAAAHSAGVIHRDIKPGNIFLTRTGQVKVLDFGLARLLERQPQSALTGVGVIMGTSAYMPPEQALGKWSLVDGRTDLFAVGAVMFRALANAFVHEGATPNDRLIAAMSQQARSIATAAPGTPRAVAEVIDRALAFRIDDRWPNAEAMQLAVRQAYAALQAAAPQPRTTVVPGATNDEPSISVSVEEFPPAIEIRQVPETTVELGIDDMLSVPSHLLDRLPEVSAVLLEDMISAVDDPSQRKS